ncbi:MAG TPA: YtxH domain-containing protein, partial [Desulfitobacteriaceae bacterium]|nr:YtxH domain-containing protein [Desulfitobacteriaceae bacterium]
MKKARKKAAKNVALGAAAGTMAGVALGILLAPKAGIETREEIAVSAKDLAGIAKNKLEDVKEKLNEASVMVKEKIKKKEAKFEDKLEEILDKDEAEVEEENKTDFELKV